MAIYLNNNGGTEKVSIDGKKVKEKLNLYTPPLNYQLIDYAPLWPENYKIPMHYLSTGEGVWYEVIYDTDGNYQIEVVVLHTTGVQSSTTISSKDNLSVSDLAKSKYTIKIGETEKHEICFFIYRDYYETESKTGTPIQQFLTIRTIKIYTNRITYNTMFSNIEPPSGYCFHNVTPIVETNRCYTVFSNKNSSSDNYVIGWYITNNTTNKQFITDTSQKLTPTGDNWGPHYIFFKKNNEYIYCHITTYDTVGKAISITYDSNNNTHTAKTAFNCAVLKSECENIDDHYDYHWHIDSKVFNINGNAYKIHRQYSTSSGYYSYGYQINKINDDYTLEDWNINKYSSYDKDNNGLKLCLNNQPFYNVNRYGGNAGYENDLGFNATNCHISFFNQQTEKMEYWQYAPVTDEVDNATMTWHFIGIIGNYVYIYRTFPDTDTYPNYGSGADWNFKYFINTFDGSPLIYSTISLQTQEEE